ncbi:MAG TPA: nuclear transport factor 2 family protein [Pyrinomonadaceae bacterium]|nr:nuclear transport factor 2 family protein [Pyrinomonadaceae bacterium]
MHKQIIVFSLFLVSSALLLACGEGPAENVNRSNTANLANANQTNQPANDPTLVTTPTPGSVTNNAPTLSPVYKAYCAAVVRKDEAAIRKFFTSDTLASFEEDMKAEKMTKLSEYVDKVTNEVCEVSNEQFKGDKAVARVRTVSYPSGYEVLFVKEGGEWKMSNIDPKREGF